MECSKALAQPLVKKCLRSERARVETRDSGQVDTSIMLYWIAYMTDREIREGLNDFRVLITTYK